MSLEGDSGSLHQKILERTWGELKAKDFDESLLADLKNLAAQDQMSHTEKVVIVVQASVHHENS